MKSINRSALSIAVTLLVSAGTDLRNPAFPGIVAERLVKKFGSAMGMGAVQAVQSSSLQLR